MQGKWIEAFKSSRIFQPFSQSIRNQPEAMCSDRAGLSSELEFLRHELRTPLTGIIGMAELIQESCLTGDKNHYVSALQESARQMAKLIDSRQSVAGSEICKPFAGKQLMKGREFLEKIILSHWPAAKKKGLVLHLCIHHELPSHWVIDPFALRQVLDNLLANAIKFTHRGYVMLEVRDAGSGGLSGTDLELRVRDTGMGVPERDAKRIYSVGEQGEGVLARKFGGSGLGLPICRRITQVVGGTIEHEPASGGGTCFRLLLPGLHGTKLRRNERLHPALLRGFTCRIALAEPARRVVGEVLRCLGVRVRTLGTCGLIELLDSGDSLICDTSVLAGNEAMRTELLSRSVPIVESPVPQLISKNYIRGAPDTNALPEINCVDLPQPVLRSNLESLLLRLALQRKINAF